MSESDQVAATGRRWRIGPYEFEHYGCCDLRHGWGCSAYGRGVGNHRSPVAAFFALRRWLREPAPPCEQP